MTEQPTLFDAPPAAEAEKILLFALGEFQQRGKTLAGRELALDRLRGAFRRAADEFGVEALTDEKSAETLEKLGARVVRKPSFVAKHPFYVTVQANLAERAQAFYREFSKDD